MTVHHLLCRQIADGITHEIYPGRISVVDGVIRQIERGIFAAGSDQEYFFDENILIAPAFIDAHGHSDISLMAMPQAAGKTAQGIGYEISGNCGLSPFPLSAHNRQHLTDLYKQYRIDPDWSDLTTYRQTLARYQPAMQLLPLVGHNTLRACVNGYEKRDLAPGKLQTMQRLLDRELSAGALGLSFGLLYVPGCFAAMEEITALMQIVARHDRIVTVHLRSEGDDLAGAVDEMLFAARAAGLRKLHISHLKTAGLHNHHKLHILEDLLQCPDLRVSGDIYCYDASMTQLSVIMPAPFDKLDDVTLMKKLQDENFFLHQLEPVRRSRPAEYWQRVRLLSLPEEYRELSGLLLPEAAAQRHLSSEELFLQILRVGAPMATAAFHTLSSENMQKLAALDNVVPGSDESARDLQCDFGSSHPRGFGNHAEYFALRRKQGAADWQIIAEMSRKIADIFALGSIGRIAPGCRAAFAVIDKEKYASRATYRQPHQLATGAKLLVL